MKGERSSRLLVRPVAVLRVVVAGVGLYLALLVTLGAVAEQPVQEQHRDLLLRASRTVHPEAVRVDGPQDDPEDDQHARKHVRTATIDPNLARCRKLYFAPEQQSGRQPIL